MRYEPPPQSPFNLNPNPPNSAGGEPSSVSSFSSHMSTLSSFSNMSNTTTTTTPSSEYHPHHYGHPQRQTPSPISTELSRSRSRSRSQVGVNGEPPSTNGGPARRTRAKRGSVSSVSPPPLHRATQPLVIPGSNGRGPASPLSLHTNGWGFLGNGNTPGANPGSQPNGNGVANGEFSLPTPESVHGGFTAFNGALPSPIPGLPGSIGLGSLNVGSMPSNGNAVNGVSAKADATHDVASKQALIANEKRRRRRESHNAVERRRRDNINEKISELATLIPEHLLDPAAASASSPTALTAEDLIATTGAGGALGGSPGLEDDELVGGGREKSGSVDGKESKEGVKDKESKDKGDKGEKDKEGGAVKANKGMILRKSVEYIRYLQQLVTAQASRNRDLEQQLQTFKNGGIPLPDDLTISTDDALTILPSTSSSSSTTNTSSTPTSTTSSSTATPGNAKRRSKIFNGLESVEEMDTEDDLHNHRLRDEDEMDQDHDMEGTSPSVGEGEGEGDEDDAFVDDGEEVERGRKGRPAEKVKVKEELGDMETS
ncbi:hypothetical protein QCA50_011865 [Cerrena zonata]|uniref:BHLH domain-containing protein n=1 Tax=Cerrena zonata TaxID=2478898 RepID=A0AAW0G7R4_9APHY